MRGLNQDDFGSLGGVTRISQANYEAGKRPCNVDYLAHLGAHGIDVGYILTGVRSTTELPADVASYAELSPRIAVDHKEALLRIAGALADQGASKAKQLTPPIALPPIEALERGFLGVLAASQHMDEGALAHELAKRLPTMLGVLQGPLTIERDREEDAGTPATARSERQRA